MKNKLRISQSILETQKTKVHENLPLFALLSTSNCTPSIVHSDASHFQSPNFISNIKNKKSEKTKQKNNLGLNNYEQNPMNLLD